MAALLRKTLGVEVEEVGGRYGEFTVLVDAEAVITGGPLGWLGVLPSAESVLQSVRAKLQNPA